MTEPASLPVPLGWPENNIIFCTTCGIHLAMTSQPLCPVCLDVKTRGMR
jgi:rubrerythrin